MGLDMYLGVRTADGIQEVGYWRKANAIHGWFIRECANDVDECQEIPVSTTQLLQLHVQCLIALNKRTEEEVTSDFTKSAKSVPVDGEQLGEWLSNEMKMATTLALMEREFEDDSDPLRPTAGFFFGGTQKDEFYYSDLSDTATIIAEALENYPDGEFIYQASW